MQPDIQLVLRGIKRWWWVVVICPLLIGTMAFGYSAQQTPLFAASVTLRVDSESINAQGAYDQLRYAEQLAKVYQQLVTLRPVMDIVIFNLDLPYSATELASSVTAQFNASSGLITVDVSDTEPERAAAIANAIAPALEVHMASTTVGSSTGIDSEMAPYLLDLDTQITILEADIASIETDTEEGTPVPAVLGFMNDSLDDLTSLRDNLIAMSASSEAATVTALAGAVAPEASYTPNPPLTAAFGLFAGFVIACGIVLLLVYLDSTIKASADFQALVGSPLLSAVTKVPRIAEGRQQLFVIDQPSSEAAESIRLLRTNVEFASAVQEIATLAVSSPASGDGKSTVAANLAVTLSQAGFVTALIDADLRRPEQHKIFQVRNDRGLSTVLSRPDVQWHQTVIETGLTNLVLVPSGPVPPNAADLLSLGRLGDMLNDMKRLFDIIIIDTPPILPVSDALAVASHVDGMVLVCRSGRTRIDALRRATETLQRVAVRLVGVVVNQEKPGGKNNYYTSEMDGEVATSPYAGVAPNPLRNLSNKAKSGSRNLVSRTVATNS